MAQKLAIMINSWANNKYVILLNILFIVIGCLPYSAAASIIVTPIVQPLIQAAGIDPIYFCLTGHSLETLASGFTVASFLMMAVSAGKTGTLRFG